MLILLFSIVRNEISVSSVKSQVTSLQGSLGLFSNVYMSLSLSLSLYLSLYLSLSLYFCWSGHGCSSLGSDVSKVTSLQDCSLRVFSKCLCLCHVLCLCICLCNFFGHVLSSHNSEQMSQRSQVSRIAPLGCSLMEVHRQVGRQVGWYVGRQVFFQSDHVSSSL